MTKDTFDSPRRSSYGGTSAVVKSSSISRSRSNRFVAHNDGGDDKWDGNQEDFLPPHSLGRHSGNGKSVMVEILQSAKRDEDEMDDAKLDEEEERGIMASMSADDDLSLPEKDEEEEPQQQQQDLPTALEALLDLELDVHNLPALEDNQFALQEQCDAFGEMSGLSLELLALQSPHGERQQWDDIETPTKSHHYREKPPVPEELSPRNTKQQFQSRATEVISAGMPDLTSPSQHVAPFQPSPCYSADGDEYDLASPVALPDTPDASHTYVSRWESAPDLRYDDDDDACYGDVAPQRATRVPSLSVSKRDQRTPSSPPGAFLRNPRISPTRRLPSASARSSAATGAHQPQVQQQQPASVPKRKVKHGGIYSLLLKNRSGEQDQPVLVDEKRSPEVPEDSPSARSASKKSPPATFGKAQHGSIYRMLRRRTSSSSQSHSTTATTTTTSHG